MQNMIKRKTASMAKTLASEFKVLAIVGPRQSGRTTLCRSVFAGKPYVSLESPDDLRFAQDDPRGFLAEFPDGAVIDEVQRVPDLFSYLQGIVDERREPGQFILTGSQHFGLMDRISQSLAGRVGFLQLLPFCYRELVSGKVAPESLSEALFKGGYPPLYDQPLVPHRWLDAYLTTYVERDVRQLINVRDLNAFRLFVRLCAGNIGQLLNMSRIGSDVGVDQKTVRAWVGILEASFIVRLLQPHHRNFRKRMVKTPKLYFHDVGLAARLLGIDAPDQLTTHAMRGPLFENWVITELMKERAARGESDNLYFWRSHSGREIDVIVDRGTSLDPIEIKSGQTIASDWFAELNNWQELAGEIAGPATLVYGGDRKQTRSGVRVVPWQKLATAIDRK